ncbi:Vps62-related protein [Solirubrobacter deserti]|uniref:Vps62-related protein n=1 Tax=Solirubrobacter deserti TaxID=2282478 RepID=A0ABT4RFN3_9ACTN|nr:Vps62-related protein [Solirubrobacter deserti]MDA0137330.1 Vps62-related protein [Solirubrobacter deserti]
MLISTATAATLTAFAPVVVHDAQERHPLTGVHGSRPVLYARASPADDGGTWFQYWLYYDYQDQDRGIVRTGRHEGDWELAQYRVDENDRLVEAVYGQHSGAERCHTGGMRFWGGGRPIVYAAHGSHASYFEPGTRDRLWPDPNDEADGLGDIAMPDVVEITRTSPPWMRDPHPWGSSRASKLVPPEQDSPLGPAFQPTRWDANAFAAGARECQVDCNAVGRCDAPEKAMTAGGLFALAALVLLTLRRARRRRPPGGATA